ncbi:MAG: hypothetical protein ACUVXB_06220 [Bryobacteraceae bacterium]
MRYLLSPVLVLASVSAWAQPAGKPPVLNSASVQQYEDGPAVPPGRRFVAGEAVFFSLQVSSYTLTPSQQVRLSYRIQAFDPEGIPLVESHAGKLEAELTDLDKDWRPKVRHSFVIPPYAPAGDYYLTASVRDEISGLESTVKVPFQVSGRTVAPSHKLVIRDFRFLASESAREPLLPAVYRSGERLWARFDLTGYKMGNKNRIEVTYGLSILSPSGKVLFTEPEAAREADAPFYPKRFFEGIISLEIQPRTTPGEYTLVIFARDHVGGQDAELREKFRVQ